MSSDGGPDSAGNRRRSTSTTAAASSIASVVCTRYDTRRGSATWTRSAVYPSGTSWTRARPQVGDHVRVVHDLLADVHRWTVPQQRLLDRGDGAADPGAERARRREYDPLDRGGGGPHRQPGADHRQHFQGRTQVGEGGRP